MKLSIQITIIDDDGTPLLDESARLDANKSGVVHALKPMGDALIHSASLGLFYKGKIAAKDSLGNVRQIAGEIVELPAPEEKPKA